MSRQINKIILHCSASDNPDHDDISVMNEWHKARGFKTTVNGKEINVGYHYFIKKNGTEQIGRPESSVGAHCQGENTSSIGICLHGFDVDEFTEAQFNTLAKRIKDIQSRYPEATIHGHNEFANKACPVFSVDTFIDKYL
jgi:N-acetyl-anhydromuramyl-L-alanine amidase AmpD